MLQSDLRLLDDWAHDVTAMFHGEVPYLVGSALTTADYRDVDLRLILHDEAYVHLGVALSVGRLNLAISLWGRKVTGLPIDFQIQGITEANRDYGGQRRDACGIRSWDDT